MIADDLKEILGDIEVLLNIMKTFHVVLHGKIWSEVKGPLIELEKQLNATKKELNAKKDLNITTESSLQRTLEKVEEKLDNFKDKFDNHHKEEIKSINNSAKGLNVIKGEMISICLEFEAKLENIIQICKTKIPDAKLEAASVKANAKLNKTKNETKAKLNKILQECKMMVIRISKSEILKKHEKRAAPKLKAASVEANTTSTESDKQEEEQKIAENNNDAECTQPLGEMEELLNELDKVKKLLNEKKKEVQNSQKLEEIDKELEEVEKAIDEINNDAKCTRELNNILNNLLITAIDNLISINDINSIELSNNIQLQNSLSENVESFQTLSKKMEAFKNEKGKNEKGKQQIGQKNKAIKVFTPPLANQFLDLRQEVLQTLKRVKDNIIGHSAEAEHVVEPNIISESKNICPKEMSSKDTSQSTSSQGKGKGKGKGKSTSQSQSTSSKDKGSKDKGSQGQGIGEASEGSKKFGKIKKFIDQETVVRVNQLCVAQKYESIYMRNFLTYITPVLIWLIKPINSLVQSDLNRQSDIKDQFKDCVTFIKKKGGLFELNLKLTPKSIDLIGKYAVSNMENFANDHTYKDRQESYQKCCAYKESEILEEQNFQDIEKMCVEEAFKFYHFYRIKNKRTFKGVNDSITTQMMILLAKRDVNRYISQYLDTDSAVATIKQAEAYLKRTTNALDNLCDKDQDQDQYHSFIEQIQNLNFVYEKLINQANSIVKNLDLALTFRIDLPFKLDEGFYRELIAKDCEQLEKDRVDAISEKSSLILQFADLGIQKDLTIKELKKFEKKIEEKQTVLQKILKYNISGKSIGLDAIYKYVEHSSNEEYLKKIKKANDCIETNKKFIDTFIDKLNKCKNDSQFDQLVKKIDKNISEEGPNINTALEELLKIISTEEFVQVSKEQEKRTSEKQKQIDNRDDNLLRSLEERIENRERIIKICKENINLNNDKSDDGQVQCYKKMCIALSLIGQIIEKTKLTPPSSPKTKLDKATTCLDKQTSQALVQ